MTTTALRRSRGSVKPARVLTAEQLHAVDTVKEGDDTSIGAFAGAAKTTTLELVARALTHSGSRCAYLAFNRGIAQEAKKKFPSSTDCRTTHSHAFRGCLKRGYTFERLPKVFVARNHLSGSAVAGAAVGMTLQNFFYSDAKTITEQHLPRGAGEEILETARELWDEMRRPESGIPLGHDPYFKIWSLSQPRIDADVILLDEAQDSNPALLGLLRRQKAQLVIVGDPNQQIYAWRGAQDAMDYFKDDGFTEVRLTKSFRFGEAIAAHVDAVLEAMGEKVPLTGNEDVESEVVGHGPADMVLCRTNAGVIAEVLALGGAHVLGGTAELQRLIEDVERIQAGQTGRTPELFGFDRWDAVQDFSATEEGSGLRGLCGMVHKHGVEGLWRALSLIDERPRPGCVTISTTHKAKGQEWPSVRISQDFMPKDCEGDDPPDIPLAERRLFYVATTRAQQRLVIDPEILHKYQN